MPYSDPATLGGWTVCQPVDRGWGEFLRLLAGISWVMVAIGLGSLLSAKGAEPALVRDCNASSLLKAIKTETTIRFGCSGVIPLDSPLTLRTGESLSIDGQGQDITLDGHGKTRLFEVSPGAALTLNNLSLTNGSAASGGAIATAGRVSLTGVTLSGNSAGDGGAVDNSGVLTIARSTFKDNVATAAGGRGGAIRNGIEATLTVDGSTFIRNENRRGLGGAIANFFGEANITTSLFEANRAMTGGAVDNVGRITVTRSTFESNNAVQGGALSNSPAASDSFASATIANSTFSENSATTGGAISNAGSGRAMITNNTFASNEGAQGAHLWSQAESLFLRNNILAGSRGDESCAIADARASMNSPMDGGGNLVEDASCGTSSPAPGLMLDPLRDNGGPTPTIAVAKTGPAFQAGVPATCTAGEPLGAGSVDQRGFPRTTCSAGAFEPQFGLPAAAILALNTPIIEGSCIAAGGSALAGTAERQIRTILWEWGDGTQLYAWFPAIHQYRQPGTYQIRVTGYWTDGAAASATMPIRITGAPDKQGTGCWR